MSLLTIIVPVYNQEKYLDGCIRSILKQTFTDFQLILINDGSTDGSAEICNSYQFTDKRVKVIHQANQGVHAARNAGLGASVSKYIGFVDSDDTVEEGMFTLLVNNAEKFGADISICGIKRVYTNKVHLHGGNNKLEFFDADEGVKALLNGNILLSSYDKIYRRGPVKDIMFEPAVFEDAYYNFQALKSSNLTVYDDAIMYNYMVRDTSASIAAFSEKYMNGLTYTKNILNSCLKEMPQLGNLAKAFDFTNNMIFLNALLLGSKHRQLSNYKKIIGHLRSYAKFYRSAEGISRKYRYGYLIFTISPLLYTAILRIYSISTGSEHLARKSTRTISL